MELRLKDQVRLEAVGTSDFETPGYAAAAVVVVATAAAASEAAPKKKRNKYMDINSVVTTRVSSFYFC